jgi:hypothetical protein
MTNLRLLTKQVRHALDVPSSQNMVKGIPENIRGMIEHLPSEQKVTFQAPVEKKKKSPVRECDTQFFPCTA